MNDVAPLAKLAFISEDINLVLAGLIGFGFGFFLERAGFGSAIRLTNQWFGKDWSVFRVMFTAIVTAMLGLIALGDLNLMNMDALYLNATYLYPQMLGGLLMGVGFVIGGYCPGTSFVGAASGKLDALYYIAGMLIGSFVFAEMYPLVEGFANSGALGHLTIPEWLGVNPWMVAIMVVMIAVLGFWGANLLEKKFNQTDAEET